MLTLTVGYSLVQKEKGKPTRYATRNVIGMLDTLAGVGNLESQLPDLYGEIQALIRASVKQALEAADADPLSTK